MLTGEDLKTFLARRYLEEIIKNNDLNVLNAYCSEDGLDPDTTVGFGGASLLMKAVQYSNKNAVMLLLERGTDVNRYDYNHNTALHLAVMRADLEMIKLLIEHGADLNMENLDGRKPLDELGRNIDICMGDATGKPGKDALEVYRTVGRKLRDYLIEWGESRSSKEKYLLTKLLARTKLC